GCVRRKRRATTEAPVVRPGAPPARPGARRRGWERSCLLERVPHGYSIDLENRAAFPFGELAGQDFALDVAPVGGERLTAEGVGAGPSHAHAVRDLEAGPLAGVLQEAHELPGEALPLEVPIQGRVEDHGDVTVRGDRRAGPGAALEEDVFEREGLPFDGEG